MTLPALVPACMTHTSLHSPKCSSSSRGTPARVIVASLGRQRFLVVLNKVDQLDNNVDFARAFGTLGWALSKVIPQKDIPMVWTMYNEPWRPKPQCHARGSAMTARKAE